MKQVVWTSKIHIKKQVNIRYIQNIPNMGCLYLPISEKKNSMWFFCFPPRVFHWTFSFVVRFFPLHLQIEASRPRSKELAWLKSRYSKPWEFHSGWWLIHQSWGEKRLGKVVEIHPHGFFFLNDRVVLAFSTISGQVVGWEWDFWNPINSTDFFSQQVEVGSIIHYSVVDEKNPVATRNTSKILRIKMECWWNWSKRYGYDSDKTWYEIPKVSRSTCQNRSE